MEDKSELSEVKQLLGQTEEFLQIGIKNLSLLFELTNIGAAVGRERHV